MCSKGKNTVYMYFSLISLPEKLTKKKKMFFGDNLNINGWERYVNYKALQCLIAETVVNSL